MFWGGTSMKASQVVAKRIKELCEENEISYYTLSYKAAISMSTLMHAVNGGNITIKTLNKLCNGLGISLTNFFDTEYFSTCEQEDD